MQGKPALTDQWGPLKGSLLNIKSYLSTSIKGNRAQKYLYCTLLEHTIFISALSGCKAKMLIFFAVVPSENPSPKQADPIQVIPGETSLKLCQIESSMFNFCRDSLCPSSSQYDQSPFFQQGKKETANVCFAYPFHYLHLPSSLPLVFLILKL